VERLSVERESVVACRLSVRVRQSSRSYAPHASYAPTKYSAGISRNSQPLLHHDGAVVHHLRELTANVVIMVAQFGMGRGIETTATQSKNRDALPFRLLPCRCRLICLRKPLRNGASSRLQRYSRTPTGWNVEFDL